MFYLYFVIKHPGKVKQIGTYSGKHEKYLIIKYVGIYNYNYSPSIRHCSLMANLVNFKGPEKRKTDS